VNLATVKTLFRTEIRMVVRDRRMLITSVVLPLLITPLMFLGSSWGIKRQEKKLQEMTYKYAVTGSRAAEVRALLAATSERLAAGAASNKTAFKFEETRSEDPAAALEKGNIQFFLEGFTAKEPSEQTSRGDKVANTQDASRDAGRGSTGVQNSTNAPTRPPARAGSPTDESDDEPALTGAMVVRIVFRADRHESASGKSRMHEALAETRRFQRSELLKSRGLGVVPAQLAVIHERDLASKSQVAGLSLGRSLTVLLLLFILSSGAVVATDSLAGEKERGTLETLLTTAAGRMEILAAKQLVIIAVALVITSIQILNLLAYAHFKLIPVPANLAAALKPSTAILLFVLYAPLGALAANVLLLVSGFARSYKEAQMWFMPVLLVGLAPALAPLLPGIPLRSAAVLVPVANIALAAKEILIGTFDWPMIAISWAITAGAAVWAARIGARTLVQEKLITASEMDAADLQGGPALFERRVLRWFAIMWAVLVIASSYTETLDLRLQIIINLGGIFFGGCWLMMRVYRLEPRVALALRAPRPAVWLGVLAGVPGGFLTAVALSQLSNLVIPTPSRITESFGEAVIPASIPFLQLLTVLTVLPGVFEEITFRGMLLHGLRRRLHPALLAIVVGITFGFFHVALFRFVPTACLGIMFAAVTMLTGSIYPAMLWHACSNAVGVMASRWKMPETELGWVCYATGAGLLAVAFWIFWRNRTPYPGLRPWKRSRSREARKCRTTGIVTLETPEQ
jgi:sodium transport system permease protein